MQTLRIAKSRPLARLFSYTHNFPSVPNYYFDGREHINDWDLEDYPIAVQTFLGQRWTTKREIPPKIRTIDEGLNPPEWFYPNIQVQRLVPLDVLYENYLLQKMDSNPNSRMNSQYVISILAQEYEKPMYDALLQKNVVNGFVPPSLDLPFVKKIKEKTEALVNVFYEGDELTLLDKELQLLYLKLKQEKMNKYKQRPVDRFRAKFFPSDISRMQAQEQYRMIDPEYFFKSRPIYFEYQWQRFYQGNVYGEVKDTSKWSSFKGIFSQRRREENETRKRADILLSRIFHYIECYEFVHNLNMPQDFLRLQASANIHLWLLVQRLRHFSHNVAAQKLAEELVKLFSEITYEEFSKLDLNRRRKKARMILDSCEQSREEFMFHFYGDSLSADNPYYKMDALVWKNLFRRKPEDRYLDEVYKFGHYFVKMFEYVNTLSFEDIAHGLAINWNAGALYGNYKDYMTSLVPPLSETQLQEEKESPYTVKRYDYEYKHPQELTLQNLKRTFANLVAKDKLFGLKLDPNTSSKFDALSSERKLEVIEGVLSALKPVQRRQGYEDEIAVSRRNLEYERDTTQLDFLTWAQSYFSLLRPQVKEMIQRKISIQEMEAQLKTNQDISIFEAERVADVRSGAEFIAETEEEWESVYEKSLKEADREGNVEGEITHEPSLSKDRRAAPTFEELVRISEENRKKTKKWRFF